MNESEIEQIPLKLTEHLFLSLMNQPIKLYGVLQLVQFHKKKDGIYSTRLSDGYFRLKVMLIHEVAEQIKSKQIELFSIIRGYIKNYGKGVVIIKQKTQVWKYHSNIGFTKEWKLFKSNFNSMGSNLIPPKQQQDNQNLNLQGQTQQMKVKQVQQNNQGQSFKRRKKLLIISQEKSENTNKKIQDTKLKKQDDHQDVKTMFEHQNSHDLFINQIKPKFVSEQKNNVIFENEDNSVVDSDDFSFIDARIRQNKIQNIQRKSLKISLKQQKKCSKSNKKKQSMTHVLFDSSSDEDSQIFKNIIKRKKQMQMNSAKLNRQKQKIKKQLEQVCWSQNQTEGKQDEVGSNDNSFDLMEHLRQQEDKVVSYQDLQVQQNLVTISQILAGVVNNRKKRWGIKIKVLALGSIINSVMRGIVVDSQCKGMMDIIFTNMKFNKMTIQQDQYYIIWGAKLNEIHMMGKIYEIQLNWKDSIKIIKQNRQIYSSNNEQNYYYYESIMNIPKLQLDKIINIYGVIKSCTIHNNITKYEILNVQSHHAINFINFDYNQSISQYDAINSSITIFNAKVNLFRGKVNICSTIKTIVKYNWLPNQSSANYIMKFLKDGNNVKDIVVQLYDFQLIRSIKQAQQLLEGSQFFLENVCIIQINNNFQYDACQNCLKKVVKLRCRQCGFLDLRCIIKKILIRGIIGNETGHLNVVWFDNNNNELNEGFKYFKQKNMLTNMKIWISKGFKQTYTILKMQPQNIEVKCSSLIKFIKNRTIL